MKRTEFELLTWLESDKNIYTQREIAEKLNISLGTVNNLIKDLSTLGYIIDGKITEKGIGALEPYRVKRAIFLAAGFGSRMIPLTFNTPKPLIRVHGTRMIDTLLDAVVAAGIPEIIIVRGYLSEQFDQLLYKYPNVKFVENPLYNEANNISSAMCVRYKLENAYILEADIVLSNPKLITKYQYNSNIIAVPTDTTDDWCVITDKDGIIKEEKIGGSNCYRNYGITYFDKETGSKFANDIEEVYKSPGGKERYWEQVALVYKKGNYKIEVRPCKKEDILEIDTFNELKEIDKLYAKN